MFDKNGHNPSCGYAGDIVAYLYDEIDSVEKLKFESHLGGCQSCGTELAAFSNVRSSVIDWRTEEFGWLPTPQIVIPYETVEESPVVVAESRGTILTDLKRLFSFAPWPPAFAAFGALAVLAGLAFFAVSYVNNKQGVSLADNKNAGQPAPTVEPVKSPAKDEMAVANTSPKQKGPDQVVVPERSNAPENDAIKISTPAPNAPKNKSIPVSNKPGEKTTTPEKQKAPNLNNYAEEEDDTLRLADLFEEVDTRE